MHLEPGAGRRAVGAAIAAAETTGPRGRWWVGGRRCVAMGVTAGVRGHPWCGRWGRWRSVAKVDAVKASALSLEPSQPSRSSCDSM